MLKLLRVYTLSTEKSVGPQLIRVQKAKQHILTSKMKDSIPALLSTPRRVLIRTVVSDAPKSSTSRSVYLISFFVGSSVGVLFGNIWKSMNKTADVPGMKELSIARKPNGKPATVSHHASLSTCTLAYASNLPQGSQLELNLQRLSPRNNPVPVRGIPL